MCIAAVLFSLIPVLSGYAVYLAVATVVTRGSPAVQWTFGTSLAAVVLGVLVWAVRRRYTEKPPHAAAKAGPETPPPPSPDNKNSSTRDPT